MKVNYDKQQADSAELKASVSGFLQDFADQRGSPEEVITALETLKQTMAAAVAGPKGGPTDQAGVAKALRDPATRVASSREYGIQWLAYVKDLSYCCPSRRSLHGPLLAAQAVCLSQETALRGQCSGESPKPACQVLRLSWHCYQGGQVVRRYCC